ncbi:AAA family ATPase [Pseudobutyrivibrio xylanivorans]|uniref:AAA family ATPase n=1 Tax=Pseudobutyrivibrio xylanivorans TaxID=185007 RepID=A0A5P6VW76_PSEXY|nr:AAA family ATPase [Pseudobutyrivibrio xylanivorans]QFJ56101.1 AAA family ATPase [Pseudobutyrivibrio xylanivorans]
MKGKYHIIVQNARVKFEFDIKRNITIIRGDSATGKTTLMNLVETHERLGDESGITISCDKKCKTLNNSNWESVIEQSNECIIFIDEETRAIKTVEFAEKIRESNNYYVIITRESLPNLPYSVEEVYGIHTAGKYADVRQTYNSFYRLYTMDNKVTEAAEVIIVEDSNSGFEFFNAVKGEDIQCISAGGKTRIRSIVNNYNGQKVLIIADGAAFGSEMSELYLYMMSNPKISLYLPESFEWIILASGLIDGKRIAGIIERPEDHM